MSRVSISAIPHQNVTSRPLPAPRSRIEYRNIPVSIFGHLHEDCGRVASVDCHVPFPIVPLGVSVCIAITSWDGNLPASRICSSTDRTGPPVGGCNLKLTPWCVGDTAIGSYSGSISSCDAFLVISQTQNDQRCLRAIIQLTGKSVQAD